MKSLREFEKKEFVRATVYFVAGIAIGLCAGQYFGFNAGAEAKEKALLENYNISLKNVEAPKNNYINRHKIRDL
jgi:hypothetical protein